MRINWFSPIEAARTGIAQYSNMIVPWLARHADVCVWTTQQRYDNSITKHAEVRHYSLEALPWPELNRGELTFFHFGNNVKFHFDVWLASQQYPGIAVLHDTCYPDFLCGVREKLRQGKMKSHQEIAQRLEEASEGSRANPYLPLRALLRKTTAALVHSAAEFDLLARSLNCPLVFAPLPYEPAPTELFRQWSSLRGEKRSRKRLIIFGYLNANRRVTSVLEVLAKFRAQFELHLCGELSDSVPIERKIQSLGLQDTVTVTGFVEDLDQELARADLAINLRNPTMGEASGSQLRIWDHALPSIVTKIGWYAQLPEGSVCYLNPDSEQEDLAGLLDAYLEDPGRFANVGANGRRALLANHSPSDYAQGLVALAEHSRSFQCSAAAQQLGARVGNEMRNWFDPTEQSFAGHIAQEITEILG